MNYLSIDCNPVSLPESKEPKDIVKFTRLFELPTAEQVKAGLDMNNYKAEIVGSVDALGADTYTDFNITGLNPETTYVAFFALEAQMNGVNAMSDKNSTIALTFTTLSKPYFLALLILRKNRDEPGCYLPSRSTSMDLFGHLI